MCKMTQIEVENMPAVKKALLKQSSGVGGSVPPSKPSLEKKKSPSRRNLAFPGARFDKKGFCPKHPDTQLANPTKDENGRVIYQELKAHCPSCQRAKHKSKKTTSLGGGKVRSGHRVHGTPSVRSRSRSRDARGRNGEGDGDARSQRSKSASSGRSRSRSRAAKPRKEHPTPFDAKGRCHYHKSVQLAAKKQFGGGWKVLHSVCPKCIEDKFDDDRDAEVLDDGASVRSSSSRKSVSSIVSGHAHGKFDKHGCCALHGHVQVAKKRVFGKGWKVIQACPACEGTDAADDRSVRSGRSAKSASSRRSTRSARSARSTASRSVRSGGRPGKASTSGRYGAMPFDGDGYCCRHPHVQLARKKALGGFKIVHDVCPDCAAEDGAETPRRRRRSSSRRRSTGRVFDDSGSECSSHRSGRSGRSASSGRKKRIRVKNLRTQDEEGKKGRYSGYVDDDHRPNGQGAMRYENGEEWEGAWCEGSRVHGKSKGGKGSKQ